MKDKAEQDDTLSLMVHDVTGMVTPMQDWITSNQTAPPSIPPVDFGIASMGIAPDVIISLNLLSQLPLRFLDKAEEKNRPLDAEAFSHDVMMAHIAGLKSFKGPSLMMADVEHQYFNKTETLETIAALPKAFTTPPQKTWEWNIAPIGEADPSIGIRHTVGAWTFPSA